MMDFYVLKTILGWNRRKRICRRIIWNPAAFVCVSHAVRAGGTRGDHPAPWIRGTKEAIVFDKHLDNFIFFSFAFLSRVCYLMLKA